MLKYTQHPKWIKKSEILRNVPLRFDTLCCDTVLPTEFVSEQLVSNEVFEIDIITEGGGICQIFGQSIPCRKGDIFIIPPDIPHNCYVNESADKLYISRVFLDINDWFSGDISDMGNQRFCYGVFCGGSVIAYATLNASAYESVMQTLGAISSEVAEKRQDWQEVVRAELSVLFITLKRYIEKAEHVPFETGKEWHYASVAVRMVMENFSDSELKLETLAESLYISKSQFSRLFKDFTGESFSEYLRRVRMNHACRLLRETDMSVEQIVKECGMRDVRSFYKNFQNYTGKTPSQYKENKKTFNIKGDKIMVLLSDISEKMQQGRGKVVAELVQAALDEGCAPEKILNEGLLSGMGIIGEKFRNNEIFVPEVLVAARAMNMGAQILKPYLAASDVTNIGKVCLGTVHGDLHDIGKNLVKMMMEGKGIEVIDLGTDVPAETFVKTAIEQNCDVICCSALLTTTMGVMADVVKAAEAAGIRDNVKIMIGGAPVTDDFCKQIGADAYTADAASAANLAYEYCKAK
ncbi:MAG: helix-turn-helix domain-containing protein [Clostridia bacterium]|nr:helix-turn-helix domain-containing protein [Clostridia bacterium]